MKSVVIQVMPVKSRFLSGPWKKLRKDFTFTDKAKLLEAKRFGIDPQEHGAFPRMIDKKGRFLTGLLARVRAACEKRGYEVVLKFVNYPKVKWPKVPKKLPNGMKLRDYQREGPKAIFASRPYCGVLNFATNAGKAPIAAVVALMATEMGLHTTILVPNATLCNRTSKELRDYIGESVSVESWQGGRCKPADVVVMTNALAQNGSRTLYERRIAKREHDKRRALMFNRKPKVGKVAPVNKRVAAQIAKTDVLIPDECHYAGAEGMRALLSDFPAYVRVGLSGTAVSKTETKNFRNVLTEAHIGPVKSTVRNEELIKRGYSAKPVVYIITDRKAFTKRGYSCDGIAKNALDEFRLEQTAMQTDPVYNRTLAFIAKAFAEGGLKPAIFTVSVKSHLPRISEAVKEENLRPCLVWGAVSPLMRDKAMERFTEKDDAVLLGSTVVDEGVNLPAISMLQLAGGGKSYEKLLQRTGRGLRRKVSGLNRVAFVDYLPPTGRFVRAHAMRRIKLLREENYEIVFINDITEFASKARRGWKGLLGSKRYARERSAQKKS